MIPIWCFRWIRRITYSSNVPTWSSAPTSSLDLSDPKEFCWSGMTASLQRQSAMKWMYTNILFKQRFLLWFGYVWVYVFFGTSIRNLGPWKEKGRTFGLLHYGQGCICILGCWNICSQAEPLQISAEISLGGSPLLGYWLASCYQSMLKLDWITSFFFKAILAVCWAIEIGGPCGLVSFGPPCPFWIFNALRYRNMGGRRFYWKD